MNIDNLFHHASSIMTVVSLVTFLGIVAWAYSKRRTEDFAEAANLPFADEEQHHAGSNRQPSLRPCWSWTSRHRRQRRLSWATCSCPG